MAHRQRHDGVLEMNGIDRPMPITLESAAILPDCALRARWKCRQCRRLLAGDTLVVRMPLTQLATAALTMNALACPKCGSAKIAMVGET